MSRAASLPGAELFLRSRIIFEEATCPGQLRCLGQNFWQKICFFFKRPLAPGSFAAWGRTFSRKSTFFEEATCPRQLRCRGQNIFQKIDFFLRKPLVRGSFAAWGGTFPRFFFLGKDPLVLGSFAAWGRTFSRISICFGRSHLSQAASLPGAHLFTEF